MTLELLICTIDDGICGLEERLLPMRSDVCYLVSWQHTSPVPPPVPEVLAERRDVRVVQLDGRGLCRNRNHALEHAAGDILKICDDDETWTNEDFDNILDAFRSHPECNIIHFKARGLEKSYPPHYVSSWEIVLRRDHIGELRFDERFGLGSPCLSAGEEDVFLSDARRLGLSIHYEPEFICQIQGPTTGNNITSPSLQRSKGAAFYRTGGLAYSLYKSVRESLGWTFRRHINPVPMFRNMLWGINYIRKWQA